MGNGESLNSGYLQKYSANDPWIQMTEQFLKEICSFNHVLFNYNLNNSFFFQISGTRIGRILTSKDQLARHPRMVNSSEEDTQSPVFDNANANANADSANEIITVEHNKRGFDAIPQPTENLS